MEGLFEQWETEEQQKKIQFLVVGHQVCTHLRRDFDSLLFIDPLKIIKVSRLTFWQLEPSAPCTDFLWDYGLETG